MPQDSTFFLFCVALLTLLMMTAKCLLSKRLVLRITMDSNNTFSVQGTLTRVVP